MQQAENWKRAEIATAVGGGLVVSFWALYFAANDVLGLVEPAIIPFEESFVVADAMFAGVLFAASFALHRRRMIAPFLLSIAGSMSIYLGVLDATFYARNGLFFPVSVNGTAEFFINVLCVAGGLFGLRLAWRMWRSQ